jgi:glycosyltransferase involved in cell wall biosynthesis
MKILMTSYEFPPLGGGGAQVVRGLSRELVRLGHEVDLVTMGFHGLPSRETVNGVRVLRVPRRPCATLLSSPPT